MGASLSDAEVVIEDAVSVVACDCWSIDLCRVGGWNTFCSGFVLARKRVSCAYFVLPDRLAADANGKLGLPCEPESSISRVPSPSSKVSKSRGRCCLKRGGRLNNWLRCTGWSVSDKDEELEEDEAGLSGKSTESFNGLGGAAADENRRSSSFGLVKFRR
jgi:hypothetical protein